MDVVSGRRAKQIYAETFPKFIQIYWVDSKEVRTSVVSLFQLCNFWQILAFFNDNYVTFDKRIEWSILILNCSSRVK